MNHVLTESSTEEEKPLENVFRNKVTGTLGHCSHAIEGN